MAGAIEAVASTGGQLMPPVMGAAAFLMSDMTGISYYEIARAALLPAILYYIVLFSVVHLEALKRNIPIIDTKDIPSIWETLKNGGHLLLSLPVFIYMMFDGYSVMYASIWSLMMAVALSYLRRSSWNYYRYYHPYWTRTKIFITCNFLIWRKSFSSFNIDDDCIVNFGYGSANSCSIYFSGNFSSSRT